MREAQLQVHPEVDNDLIELSAYIAMDSPAAAVAVERAITSLFELLACKPQMGTEFHPLRRTLRGIRMFVVTEYPNYLIYYRPLPDNTGVRILYVMHAARDAATFAKEHRRQ
jgi:plasmid stabilization system protein ParE